MNFDSVDQNQGLDPTLMESIKNELHVQRFRELMHKLTIDCWDMCVSSPGSKMDGKTQTCLSNCVNRFIDASIFINKRLESASKQAGGF